MRDSVSFVGTIPEMYDRGLGPAIFVDYANDLTRRVAALAPERVLETAAGTGIVTRRLRDSLPAGATLIASDLSPSMIEVARTKFQPGEQVDFRAIDAMALPFPDRDLAAVVCQFGVMFYPDKDKSYRETYRVLRTGGHYLFNVWDAHQHNPFARIEHEISGSFFPTDPPQFYSVPFSYNRIDPIRDSLIDAGFDNINVAVVTLEKVIPDVIEFARGMVYGNPLIDQIRARGGVDPEKFVDRTVEALNREFGRDPARMPLQAIVFSARRSR